MQAHNAPVLAGQAQTMRAAVVLRAETDEAGRQRATLALTGCCEAKSGSEEAPASSVVRDVWLLPRRAVVVRDTIDTERDGLPADYYWQAGTFLAWAFVDGWARLGDGEQAMWVGAFDGFGAQELLQPTGLFRHEGSRGALTLRHSRTLGAGGGAVWWIFAFDREAGWTPPTVSLGEGRLGIRLADESEAVLPIEPAQD